MRLPAGSAWITAGLALGLVASVLGYPIRVVPDAAIEFIAMPARPACDFPGVPLALPSGDVLVQRIDYRIGALAAHYWPTEAPDPDRVFCSRFGP